MKIMISITNIKALNLIGKSKSINACQHIIQNNMKEIKSHVKPPLKKLFRIISPIILYEKVKKSVKFV